MTIYEHIQHPCTTLHLTGRAPKPPKVNDGRVGLNGKIGLLITTAKAATAGSISRAAGTDGAAGTVGA